MKINFTIYKPCRIQVFKVSRVCLDVSYPFAHQAVVEGQPYELEGCLLDEVGIENPDLCRLPRNIVSYRLPKPFCAPLVLEREQTGGQKVMQLYFSSETQKKKCVLRKVRVMCVKSRSDIHDDTSATNSRPLFPKHQSEIMLRNTDIKQRNRPCTSAD